MNHIDHVALIRPGIPVAGDRWADLGAGEGAFTLALADVLGPGSRITAVDRDRRALQRLSRAVTAKFPETTLDLKVADFTGQLQLNALDGVVMANSLHFVRDHEKRPLLERIRENLRPGGALVIVEYGADRGNLWVPHPFSFERWQQMAAAAGFIDTRLLGTVPSRFLGSIYSAVSVNP